MKIQSNFSLSNHNTFGIEAKCEEFVEYSNVEELQRFVVERKNSQTNILHIGGGSNLLFLADYKGVILHSNIKTIEIVEEKTESVLVRAGSGVIWDEFVQFCVDNGFYGAENLSYIPGEVGASPIQNVGAYGVEAKDIIELVEVVNRTTGELSTIKAEECDFGYRYSRFKGEWKDRFFVHHVNFRLSKNESYKLDYGKIRETIGDSPLSLKLLRDTIVAIRKDKLPEPSEIGSAGSFFTNPVISADQFETLKKQYPNIPSYALPNGNVKIPAGWLIEQCGWKGRKHGNAGVYEKQCLIIVNHGGATGAEIAELSKLVSKSVFDKFGIEIKPEVCFV